MASLEELYNHLKTLCSQWFYTKSEVNSSLDDKVDKESGKGLSTNDYTTTEKNKLSNLENYTHPTYTSQTKKLYKVAVDGTGHVSDATEVVKSDITALGIPAQDTTYTPATNTPTADSTNGTVGTSTKYAREDHAHPKSNLYAEASHTHAASEVSDATAHSHIGTSANADQSTINAAIDTILSGLLSGDWINLVSGDLPTASSSTMGKFYLKAITGSGQNNYEEFITVRTGTSGNYTYNWESLGPRTIDLSGYVTTSAMETALATKAASNHSHGNITNAGAIGSTAGKVVITGTNGVLTVSDMITEMNTVIEDLIEYGS